MPELSELDTEPVAAFDRELAEEFFRREAQRELQQLQAKSGSDTAGKSDAAALRPSTAPVGAMRQPLAGWSQKSVLPATPAALLRDPELASNPILLEYLALHAISTPTESAADTVHAVRQAFSIDTTTQRPRSTEGRADVPGTPGTVSSHDSGGGGGAEAGGGGSGMQRVGSAEAGGSRSLRAMQWASGSNGGSGKNLNKPPLPLPPSMGSGGTQGGEGGASVGMSFLRSHRASSGQGSRRSRQALEATLQPRESPGVSAATESAKAGGEGEKGSSPSLARRGVGGAGNTTTGGASRQKSARGGDAMGSRSRGASRPGSTGSQGSRTADKGASSLPLADRDFELLSTSTLKYGRAFRCSTAMPMPTCCSTQFVGIRKG